MDLRIRGPLEVLAEAGQVPFEGTNQCAPLAFLLLGGSLAASARPIEALGRGR
jgi:hypothetical protein